MRHDQLTKRALTLAFGGMLCVAIGAGAKNLLYTPDGRTVHIKGGALQPDFSPYRSPLESKVVDRRFHTNDATFMANEGFKMGMEGFDDMVKAGMPVAYKGAFQWTTAKEIYFYARYVLDYFGARGHGGVHMVQGPYFTMRALRLSSYNKIQRDRGERQFSNKDVLLGIDLPLVYQRTGFPRVFDDVQISYLQYKSIDPHFTGTPDDRDSFEDPMSGKKGGWGVPNTFLNHYEQRFDHDKMDITLDMGALGQFVKRRMQWADYFFHSDHKEESVVSRGKEVNLLGNDAEEGLRGWALTMASTNTMLEVKSSMFTDGKKLGGINPAAYRPADGLRYIPHEIRPDILWVGDMPERVTSLALKDNSSQLWDQASWIWGATSYATSVHRRPTVFTDNPPVDGGMVEKSLGLVAQALANTVFQNIEAMHLRNGVLVSEWTPAKGIGTSVTMRDLAMAMTASRDMAESWSLLDKHRAIAERGRKLVEDNGRFLLTVQGRDGSFHEAYSVPGGKPVGANDLSAPNWAGIRALLAAYFTTEDEAFLGAARKTFNLLNEKYWVEAQGVYRSRAGDDTVVVTPYEVGIAMAALREMMFATPTHKVEPQIERFTRWWTQTVNQSGAMQAESERTGEIYTGFMTGDDDGDGVPHAGKVGIAPLLAGKVVINVGGPGNRGFADIAGEVHNPSRFNTVRTRYQPRSKDEQLAIVLPLKNDTNEKGLVKRQPMERADGTVIPLPPSKPIQVGLGTVLNLSGRQIFEANCAACHGQFGEGIDGLPLEKDIERTHDAMFKIVNTGRFDKFMPPWGVGNGDGFGGTLTKAEMDKVVRYVQSDEFRRNNHALERGEVIAGSQPRDVWFYLSRENAAARGKKISGAADATRYFKRHQDPARIDMPSWMNVLRVKPDAELTLDDREPLMRRLGLVPPTVPMARRAD